MKETRIELSIENYNRMYTKCVKYDILIDALLRSATLSWRVGCLNLDGESAATVLRHMEPLRHDLKLSCLEEQKTKKEEEK